ncbi:MAG: DUF760 domain-containing protein [Acaryochloridaceae cyanobacterium RU_4_10]|nr:DUF760 domain-containing protein [Acaryochloridaceae cyanobacterium RU_4_10]
MNDSTAQTLGSFNSPFSTNPLAQYIQSLPQEAIAQMHQPEIDAAKLMEGNIIGLLGALPSQHFDVTIATSRESLGQLLASAMVYGYFLHTAEQRMALENAFPESTP